MSKINLSIIIPLYNTPEQYFEECLNSVREQTLLPKIKYEVIIVDDCSTTDYSKLYSKFFDLNLKVLKQEVNGGPGVARRIGIENAKGEYLTFIDADDRFYTNQSLEKLFEHTNKDYDLICGQIVEETKNGTQINIQQGYVWCFSRLYRRQFLIDNNITFNDTRANEDTSFTTLCYLCTDKIHWLDDKIYLWIYNDTSITRINNCEYKYTRFDQYLYNMTWTFQEILKRDKLRTEKVLFQFTCVWIRIYFHYLEVFQKFGFDEANKVLQIAANYYKEVYSKVCECVTPNFILQCYKNMIRTSVDTLSITIPNVSLPEFEYRVKNEVYLGYDSRFGFYINSRGDDNGDMDK